MQVSKSFHTCLLWKGDKGCVFFSKTKLYLSLPEELHSSGMLTECGIDEGLKTSR